YLTKPFSSIRRLVATVLAFLDERPSAAGAASPLDEIEEITVEPASSDSEPAAQTSFDQAQQSYEPAAPESYTSESERQRSDPPALELPEPDMHSTNDIEDLYSQSFAETVEMPHTIAERSRFNDGSADDELIETTYSEQPQLTVQPQLDERRVTEE